MVSHDMAVSGWLGVPNNVSIRNCVHECAYVSGSAHTEHCVRICSQYTPTVSINAGDIYAVHTGSRTVRSPGPEGPCKVEHWS